MSSPIASAAGSAGAVGMRQQAIDAVGGNGELGVVVIVGMDADAIGEGGKARRNLAAGADHRRRARAKVQDRRDGAAPAHRWRDRPGKSQAETIENRFLPSATTSSGRSDGFALTMKSAT